MLILGVPGGGRPGADDLVDLAECHGAAVDCLCQSVDDVVVDDREHIPVGEAGYRGCVGAEVFGDVEVFLRPTGESGEYAARLRVVAESFEVDARGVARLRPAGPRLVEDPGGQARDTRCAGGVSVDAGASRPQEVGQSGAIQGLISGVIVVGVFGEECDDDAVQPMAAGAVQPQDFGGQEGPQVVGEFRSGPIIGDVGEAFTDGGEPARCAERAQMFLDHRVDALVSEAQVVDEDGGSVGGKHAVADFDVEQPIVGAVGLRACPVHELPQVVGRFAVDDAVHPALGAQLIALDDVGGEGVAAFGDGRLDVGEVVAVVAAGVTPGEDGCGGESFDEQVGDPVRRCRRAHSFVTVIAPSLSAGRRRVSDSSASRRHRGRAPLLPSTAGTGVW